MIVKPAAAIMNVERMLKASARMPPTRGPSTPPAVMPACMMPRQKPSRFCGALALMMASVAGHSPAERPCTMRTAKSCQGVSTMPPKKYVMAKQKEARMAMSFRDFLSAKAPQIGAQMPEIRKVTEKMSIALAVRTARATFQFIYCEENDVKRLGFAHLSRRVYAQTHAERRRFRASTHA